MQTNVVSFRDVAANSERARLRALLRRINAWCWLRDPSVEQTGRTGPVHQMLAEAGYGEEPTGSEVRDLDSWMDRDR